jgi:transposase
LKSKQDTLDYADKVDRLDDLYELDNQGHIDLFFGDEAGFSLNLNVPYGWQFADEPIRILPQRGKQVNVLGFMKSTGDQVHTFSTEGSVKAEFVIEAINSWRTDLAKPTVLVLDNARIHHSKLVKACLASWESENLYVFFLPAYSPHLNRIERLWLKTKQRWLKPTDYSDLTTLKSALAEIWAGYGDKFRVTFN